MIFKNISKLIITYIILVSVICGNYMISGNLSSYELNNLHTSQPDDNYEPNHVYNYAYDLSSHEDTWLSTIDGFGYQYNNDWYEIYVDPGYQHLEVDLIFTHAAGNIDINVYNASLDLITGSWTASDDEDIDVMVPSGGTYYLLIYGVNTGNVYDLWWNDTLSGPIDDNYEPNNNYTDAYDLSSHEDTWLSTIDDFGYQYNDDWYKITLSGNYVNLTVTLSFMHTMGNLDLALYDSTGSLITTSTSLNDFEVINIILSSSGTFYIKIYGNNSGNTYNLLWASYEYSPPSDGEPEIPGYNLWIIFSIISLISILAIIKQIKRNVIFQEKY